MLGFIRSRREHLAALCKPEDRDRKGTEKGNRADNCLVRRISKGLDSSVWREKHEGAHDGGLQNRESNK